MKHVSKMTPGEVRGFARKMELRGNEEGDEDLVRLAQIVLLMQLKSRLAVRELNG